MWQPYKIKEQINITEMYSLFTFHYDNGYSFKGETHNFWECVYVINGQITVSGDERVYTLSSGEIIFHKPLELHKFNVENESGTDLLIFSFSCEGVMSDFLKNKVFHLSTEQISAVKSMLDYIHIQNKKNSLTLDNTNVFLTNFKTSKTYSQMISTYICQLFLLLYEDYDISAVNETPDALIFEKAVNYMKAHINDQPQIAEIAEHCNISQTGLKRVFGKFSGLGVHKYLLKLKINMSIQLLNEGYTVTYISEKLGFLNQGYFSYVFKRETGFSPTEYVKNH